MREQDVWILDEFERRKAFDVKYSLRDFAKDVGLSATMLSQVLNGEKSFSLETAERILAEHFFSETEKQKITATYRGYVKKRKEVAKIVDQLFGGELDQEPTLNEVELPWQDYKKIFSWEDMFIYKCIQILNPDQLQDQRVALSFLSEKTKFSVKRIQSSLEEFVRQNLLETKDDFYQCKYSHYRWQRGEEALSEELEAFITKQNENFRVLSEHSKNQFFPCYNEEGTLATYGNEESYGVDLLHFDFVNLKPEEMKKLLQAFEEMYQDLRKLEQGVEHNDLEVSYLQLRFFEVSAHLKRNEFVN